MTAAKPVHGRIVSDGTPQGTKVEVDGQPVICSKITWTITADSAAVATVESPFVEVDVEGEIHSPDPLRLLPGEREQVEAFLRSLRERPDL